MENKLNLLNSWNKVLIKQLNVCKWTTANSIIKEVKAVIRN